MKKFFIAFVLSLITVFPTYAQDPNNPNQLSTELPSGWWVNINKVGENPFCATAKGFIPHSSVRMVKQEFRIALGHFPKIFNAPKPDPSMFIIIAAPNWNFPNTETQYAGKIGLKFKDGSTNTGDITWKRFIVQNELAFAFNEQFLSELLKEPELQIAVNGHLLGGYPLDGLKEALGIVEKCKSLLNVSATKTEMKDLL